MSPLTTPEQDAIPFDGRVVADRYQLGPKLGSGGQAVTYLALDFETGDRVAVKAFDLSDIEHWKEFELFQRECRVLRELNHPGVPDYLDQVEDEAQGRFYLVMEYIPGVSLRDIVAEQQFLVEEQLWIVALQIIEILAHLHDRDPPIVHRDVKPSNLIETPSGDIVLVDFGGVRDALRPEGGSTMVGTFGYMAPEQLSGQALPATDLYALGATLLYLGTGIEPEKLPRKGLRFDFGDKLQVSGELAQLIRRLTEPDPDDRPASAVVLRQELGAGPAALLAPGPPPDQPPAPAQDAAPLNLPDLPWPLAMMLGLALWSIGLAGTVVTAAAQYVVIPLVFALLSLLSNERERPAVKQREAQLKAFAHKARTTVRAVSRQGRDELRRSQRPAARKDEKGRRRRRDRELTAREVAMRDHQRRVESLRYHERRLPGASRRRHQHQHQHHHHQSRNRS